MKINALILTALPVAILVTGCNKSTPTSDSTTGSDNNSMSVTQQMQNAKEMATNAWEKTKEVTTNAMASTKKMTLAAWADIKESLGSSTDYAYDKKDEFVTKASADVDALDQKVKEWSDNAANATDSMKADAQAKVQALKDKQAVLGKKLDDAKNSTEATWNDAKTAFSDSYKDLKDSLKSSW